MPTTAAEINKVIFIGNYAPRKCGIATFTTDLCESYATRFAQAQCEAIAVNDVIEGYDYPERVQHEILEQDMSSYTRASDYINESGADLVCLQHEYGIFGGAEGSYILSTLRALQIPIVTTFHTIVRQPTPRQESILKKIVSLSQYLIVMTHASAALLSERYGVPPDKIRIIAHGIPESDFTDATALKKTFKIEGKTVLLTFGLLSPNKGIEYMVEALPRIVERFPEVIYIVLGETHPNLLKKEGEHYRILLQRLAADLGVENNIRFRNQFVALDDLKDFLIMADVYITPYLNEQQIVSGTLAYAFGIGNAIVSTPFQHAVELLADEKGVLVPFQDAPALSEAIIDLLENDAKRHAMQKQAYALGKSMIWPHVADQYHRVFQEAMPPERPPRQRDKTIEPLAPETRDLPVIKIDHFVRMTDSTGILQHARYSIPNHHEGYCTDDNARALILQSLLLEMPGMPVKKIDRLGYTYLAFLSYALDAESGRFKNFLSYQRAWLENTGSEDSHGRALWGLGTCIRYARQPGIHQLATDLFEDALPATSTFTSLRAWVYAILGIDEYLHRFPDDAETLAMLQHLAAKLHTAYRNNTAPDWLWFEQSLHYANAKIPQALLRSGRRLDDAAMTRDGLATLHWLCAVQTEERHRFRPVGNTFYQRGESFPIFDQQPIEAQATVSACLEALRATGDDAWHNEAWKAFQWFLGRNTLSVSLYDPHTGGCCDGLNPQGVNLNQGAESTLSFLLALTEMTKTRNELIHLDDLSLA